MWIDRKLLSHALWLWSLISPMTLTLNFQVKFWKSCISGMGQLINNLEQKGCELIGCWTHYEIGMRVTLRASTCSSCVGWDDAGQNGMLCLWSWCWSSSKRSDWYPLPMLAWFCEEPSGVIIRAVKGTCIAGPMPSHVKKNLELWALAVSSRLANR